MPSASSCTRRAVVALGLVVSLSIGRGGAFPIETKGVLETASGRHAITVEIADSPQARETGLMFRKSMPADQGMLFDFDETRHVTMWMKNTLIPLDMVFMDERGVVIRVTAKAKPQSLDLIPSGEPVRYVLELNGGAAARYGVKNGDRLLHPLIPATRN